MFVNVRETESQPMHVPYIGADGDGQTGRDLKETYLCDIQSLLNIWSYAKFLQTESKLHNFRIMHVDICECLCGSEAFWYLIHYNRDQANRK